MRILLAIPAFDEEQIIGRTLETLSSRLREFSEHEWDVVVADNGSTDRTAEIVRDFAVGHQGFRLVAAPRRGKGAAIRAAWSSAPADAYAFVDADLATDLGGLSGLLAALDGGADLAVGSRFHRESKIKRSAIRRLISRCYSLFARLMFGTQIRDLPCGFKMATRAAVAAVMPSVDDDQWFFDTEFVIRAEKSGLKTVEVPVVWIEDCPGGRRSKVDVWRVAGQYVAACLKLRAALR